ncbi:hypothetical protein HDU96_010022 [Phlyctochytrium bullatum]|nr:hypothetical protein HDU96_010022 [Phlyctochytrium bullatum]
MESKGPWKWTQPDEGFQPLTEDGALKKRVVKEGTGSQVVKEGHVTVNYTGYIWPDGPKFDSSYDRNRPLRFKVGHGEVIQGWDTGLLTMRIGEHSQLICPPDYGMPQDPISKKLADARAAKSQGNDAFRTSSFTEAVEHYQHGVQRLEYTWGADPHEAVEAKELKLALNLNLAAACLRTEEFKRAAEAAERAVDIDKASIKGWFRLGQARAGLGDWDKAVEAVDTAAKLDPADPAIPKERSRIAKLQKESETKEKSLYRKMFS